jgi:hypothetical protein
MNSDEKKLSEAYWYVEFVGGPWDGDCGVYDVARRFVRVMERTLHRDADADPFWSSSVNDAVAGEYRIGDTAFMAIISHETLAQEGRPLLWQIVSDLVPATNFYWHAYVP